MSGTMASLGPSPYAAVPQQTTLHSGCGPSTTDAKGVLAAWQPSSYIVDDCDTEIKSIRYSTDGVLVLDFCKELQSAHPTLLLYRLGCTNYTAHPFESTMRCPNSARLLPTWVVLRRYSLLPCASLK